MARCLALPCQRGGGRTCSRSIARRSATTRSMPRRATRSTRAASACRRAARCSCRPSTSAQSAARTRNELDSRDPLILPSSTRYPESAGYTLTFTQPLFRYQNWLQYEQARRPGAPGRGDLRPGLPGPDRARGAGLFRRARRRRTRSRWCARRRKRSPSSSRRRSATSRSAPRPSPTRTKRRRATT